MARINIEDRIYTIDNYRILKIAAAINWDQDFVIGKLARLWFESQRAGVYIATMSEIIAFLKMSPRSKRTHDLCEMFCHPEIGFLIPQKNDLFLISGNKKHIDNLLKLKEYSAKGGAANKANFESLEAIPEAILENIPEAILRDSPINNLQKRKKINKKKKTDFQTAPDLDRSDKPTSFFEKEILDHFNQHFETAYQITKTRSDLIKKALKKFPIDMIKQSFVNSSKNVWNKQNFLPENALRIQNIQKALDGGYDQRQIQTKSMKISPIIPESDWLPT